MARQYGRCLFLDHDEWTERDLPDGVDLIALDREAAKKPKTYADLNREAQRHWLSKNR